MTPLWTFPGEARLLPSVMTAGWRRSGRDSWLRADSCKAIGSTLNSLPRFSRKCFLTLIHILIVFYVIPGLLLAFFLGKFPRTPLGVCPRSAKHCAGLWVRRQRRGARFFVPAPPGFQAGDVRAFGLGGCWVLLHSSLGFAIIILKSFILSSFK